MALTLHVQTNAWRAQVDAAFERFPGLIPVVKGNGYGLGRRWLAELAVAKGASRLAVGTVFELEGLGNVSAECIVLTPSFDLDVVAIPPSAVLTVASHEQVEHALRFRPDGPVTVKVRTSMGRHGFPVDDLPSLLDRLRGSGMQVRSVSIHPGLVGTDADRLGEVNVLVNALPGGIEVSVSHLASDQYAALRDSHDGRSFSIRLGSALWHGDKQALMLTATALDVRPVSTGERVGYRGTTVPGDGTLVIVGAGSTHGVQPLANGDSPFHFARRRLALLESPHMHVSMVWVPAGDPAPQPGDDVDLQRPLITTAVDRIDWR